MARPLVQLKREIGDRMNILHRERSMNNQSLEGKKSTVLLRNYEKNCVAGG